MADDEKAQEDTKQEDTKVEDSSESKKAAAKTGILTWAILAIIVVLCAGSGLLLGRLLAGSGSSEKTESSQENTQTEKIPADVSKTGSKSTWYYDLEPVVANLDEPDVTRYIRVTITLEISPTMEQNEGIKLLEEKKPILTNWLTIYLAGLSLEDARGNRNLKRIQSQILDVFNEKLFPDAKPQIKHILFKEF
ncbi:MAG: flagellar basal body-associated FliL family protein, partial [Planctomycetota bacterium]